MSSLFDIFSLPVLFLLTIVFLIVAIELGYDLGKYWKKRSPSTTEGAVGGVSGITLGLLAFLLAFVVSMAVSRFDNRRELVMEDANAIRTAVLRAELLDEPIESDVRDLLSDYVDVRLTAASDPTTLAAGVERSKEILAEVWEIADQAGANGGSESASLFVQSVNDMINVNTQRSFAAIYTRLPVTILVALYICTFLSLLLTGAQSQFQGNRNVISMTVLVVVLSIVMLLIFDLDRPQEGLVTISQQPMIELQAELHEATS